MRKNLQDYFIPGPHNNYRPHSLQKMAVFGMLFMIGLSFTVTSIQSLVWISSDWLVSTILPAVIVELTNDERVDDALPDLRRSTVLDRAAQLKAADMAAKGYFSHNSPDGVTPWYWFGQAGYSFVHAGENLAIHFTDSGDVVEAWMESPTHRANILNGNYTEIGVGTAEGEYQGFKTVYVVQLFGTPAATAAGVEPEPAAEPAEVAVVIEPTPEPVALPAAPAEVTQAPPTTADTEVLAETADLSVSETRAIEPVLVPVMETVTTTESVASATDTMIAETLYTENGVALFSDFVSTSTGAAPAAPVPPSMGDEVPAETMWWAFLLTSPHIVLQIIYAVIAVFVIIALTLSIFIEIRRQHPVQVAYGVLLLFLMYGLFELHVTLSGGALVV